MQAKEETVKWFNVYSAYQALSSFYTNESRLVPNITHSDSIWAG